MTLWRFAVALALGAALSMMAARPPRPLVNPHHPPPGWAQWV